MEFLHPPKLFGRVVLYGTIGRKFCRKHIYFPIHGAPAKDWRQVLLDLAISAHLFHLL